MGRTARPIDSCSLMVHCDRAQVFARSGLQFGVIRYWMGTGECGNYFGGMKTVTRFFPKKNRTLAIGVFNSGSMIGSTLAPPLIVFLMQR
jgi:MFS transporter, ACS family, aldohexuronate transporter